jgi:quinol monooxygenase YgiN
VYAIWVTVKVKPEKLEQFLAAIEDDSICSVRDEPACERFDVLQEIADPYTYHFYEVYHDEAGFQAHVNTPHLARWRAAAEECCEPSSVPTVRSNTVFPRDYA